jgi:nucleotide-binding universal stress UspA family protein
MKILLAIDGSEPSRAAIEMLYSHPWPSTSTVRVLSVAEYFYRAHPFVGDPLHYQGLTDQLFDEAKMVSERAAQELRNTGLVLETIVRQGDPRTEIVAEAERWHADLIIVGSHGRTGLKRWFMGSVAEYVVRHAPCSVEVARAPTAQEEVSASP